MNALTEGDVRRIVREELSSGGSSIKDSLERIKPRVKSSDRVDERDEDLTGLLHPATESVGVAGFEASVGDVKGVVEVITDLGHDPNLLT